MASYELANKLRMQKKFRNLKAIQKLLENVTQLEEYLTGQSQPIFDSAEEALPSNGVIHVDKDLHYVFETDPLINTTRVTEIRTGDLKLTATIEENFFYQHMFNFALVVILLLQVIVVWAFIWCRLSKYGNQPINTPPSQLQAEEGIALREVAELPELIPQHHHAEDNNNNEDRDAEQYEDDHNQNNNNQVQPQVVIAVANRFGRYG